MKKYIMAIVFILIMINMGIVVNAERSRAERLIRVYGSVVMDGGGVEGADIVVTNIDKGYQETTKTNGSGYYEVFIKAVDSDKIQVNVDFDEYDNKKSFVLEKFKGNYEVNFEFESTSDVIIAKKFYGFLAMLKDVSVQTVLLNCLLVLIILLILCALYQWHKDIEKKKDD